MKVNVEVACWKLRKIESVHVEFCSLTWSRVLIWVRVSNGLGLGMVAGYGVFKVQLEFAKGANGSSVRIRK